jgi:hypothetical protein
MRLVSSVDEVVEVADIAARKISDVADVCGDAALILKDFEMLALEFSGHIGTFGEDGIHRLDLKWQNEEEKRYEAVDRPRPLGFRLMIREDASEDEDVPEDGEDEGPCKIAGSLDELSAQGGCGEQDRKDGVCQQGCDGGPLAEGG